MWDCRGPSLQNLSNDLSIEKVCQALDRNWLISYDPLKISAILAISLKYKSTFIWDPKWTQTGLKSQTALKSRSVYMAISPRQRADDNF